MEASECMKKRSEIVTVDQFSVWNTTSEEEQWAWLQDSAASTYSRTSIEASHELDVTPAQSHALLAGWLTCDALNLGGPESTRQSGNQTFFPSLFCLLAPETRTVGFPILFFDDHRQTNISPPENVSMCPLVRAPAERMRVRYFSFHRYLWNMKAKLFT